jgi:3-dehydroquinate synthetase
MLQIPTYPSGRRGFLGRRKTAVNLRCLQETWRDLFLQPEAVTLRTGLLETSPGGVFADAAEAVKTGASRREKLFIPPRARGRQSRHMPK